MIRNPIRRAATGALLWATGACARDAVAPERASAVSARAVSDRERTENAAGGTVVTFEGFTLGVINGQQDWQSTAGLPPTAAGVPCASYDHAIADAGAIVPAAMRSGTFGRRSLRISNAVTSGCYSDQTFSHRAANIAGEAGAWSRSTDGLTDYALPGAHLQNHFEAEWLVMSAVPGAWQPGLEVVVNPARGDEHRMSWVQMADWADGLAIVFGERSNPLAPGDIQRDTVARGLDRRTPHTIKLTMDFVVGPGNDVVRVYVDGALRHTGGSWETYYNLETKGRANFAGATPAVNRLMFRTGSDLHRGILGLPAPATLGRGFLIDQVRVATFMIAPSEAACRDGGWRDVRDAAGRSFENQGDCVNWVRHALRTDDETR